MFSKKLRALAFFLMTLMVFYVIPVNCMQDIVTALSSKETESSTEGTETSREAEPYVLGEDLSKREESAKHFRMSDGSYVAVQYAEPIHYLDENGEYTEYDNTLSVTQNTSNGLIGNLQSGNLTVGNITAITGYKANKSDISITLANSASQSTLTSISKGEYSVSIIPLSLNTSSKVVVNNTSAKPTLSSKPTIEEASKLYNHTSSVKYENLFSGADLEYVLSGSNLKENIIVNDKADSYVYSFNLNLTGLYAVLNEDGSISLIGNNTDKVEFAIPAGYMFDAQGAYSNNVTYSLLSKLNGNYTLTVTADSEWINSDDRVFPVTVDPTLTVGASTTTEIHDTYAAEGDPNAKPQGYYWLESGASTIDKRFRAYTKLANLPEIPASSIIVEATLNLYQINDGGYSGSSSGVNIAAREVTSEWAVGSLCWNLQPTVSDVILDYIHLDSSTKSQAHSLDITKVVQKWYNGTNYGIALYPVAEFATGLSGTSGKVRFASVNNPNGLYNDVPLYVIKYRDAKGIDNGWSYTSHSVGNGGTTSICDYTGNLVFVHNNATTVGNLLPLEINHVYNSCLANTEFSYSLEDSKTSMKLGLGFKLSLQETIEEKTINNTVYYVLSDGDGTDCYFEPGENSTYVSEDNSDIILTIDETNTSIKYTITDGNNNYKCYDPYGRLITIKTIPTAENGETSSNENIEEVSIEKNIVYSDGKISEIKETIIQGDNKTENTLYVFRYYDDYLYKIYNNDSVYDQYQYYYSPSPTGDEMYSPNFFEYIENIDLTNLYLRKISHFKGTDVIFEYDEDGYLTSVKDVGRSENATDYSVSYTYEQGTHFKRVTSVSENGGNTAGQSYRISYDVRQTTFQSPGKDNTYGTADDLYTTCVFDFAGNMVTSYTHNYNKTEIYGVGSQSYNQDNLVMSTVSSGVQAQNLLLNTSFEASENWGATYGNGCNGGIVTNSANAYMGNKYFSIYADTVGSESYVYQNVYLSSADTYTLSAYVNTSSVSGSGVYARVKYGGNILNSSLKACGKGWERISTTFNVETAGQYTVEIVLSNNSTGGTYIDAVQLEKGNAPSEYNMIEASGFDEATAWTLNGGTISTNSQEYISTSSALQITGNSSTAYACQVITVNTPATQSYMLSGWAKADSVPTDEARTFRLKAQIWYDENGTDTEEIFVDFNPYTDQWQYTSGAIVPNSEKTTVTKIVIYCSYDNNCNTAYFDNISLIRENAPVVYERNDDGDITSITENGKTTEISYSSSEPAENNGIEETVTVTTPDNQKFTQHIDSNGAVIDEEDENNNIKTEYKYDLFGNVISQTTINTQSTTNGVVQTDTEYSSDSKFVTSTTDSNRSKVEYAYNTVTGAVTSTTVYTDTDDSNSKITLVNKYNGSNNTLTQYFIDSDKDGVADDNEKQVNFTYDDNLLLTAMSAGNTTYNISYDNFRNITSISIFGRSVALASYTYEANNGNVKSVTYANGNTIENVYDVLDRVVAVKYNNTVVYTYTYDGNGRLFSTCDVSNNRTYYYTYDINGSIIGTREVYTGTGAEIIRTENTYDDLGRTHSISYIYGGSTYTYSFEYDENSTLTSVGLPVGTTLNYGYDDFNRLTSKEIINESGTSIYKESYTYATKEINGVEYITDYIESIKYNDSDADKESYTYDDVGNILSVTVGSEEKLSYVYDDAFQLIRENNKYANATYVYEYDRYGNITSKKTYAYTTGTLGAVTNTVTYTYGDESWGDLLTNYNGTSITYDAAGNPLNWRNADDIEWLENAGKQMSLLYQAGEGVYMYEYNFDGIRTKKILYQDDAITIIYESEYILDGTTIIQEKRTYGDGSVVILDFLYDDSGVILGITYNNNAYYYRKNLQGDITGIVNSSGTVVVSYIYDAWGNPVSITGSMSSTLGAINPIRYRGYYYDTETGFYYLQSRYYDPVVGRFISPDSTDFLGATGTTLSLNLFAYCENSPVVNIDQNGYLITGILPFLYRNTNSKKVAVLYDSRSSGFLGWNGTGFKRQGELIINKLKRTYTVESYGFKTIDEFIKNWNRLRGIYERIYIIAHGSAGSIDCDGQRLMKEHYGDTEYTIRYMSQLNRVNVKSKVYLYSCNGATVDKWGNTAAGNFAQKVRGVPVRAVMNGKLNINYFTGLVENVGGFWIEITYI